MTAGQYILFKDFIGTLRQSRLREKNLLERAVKSAVSKLSDAQVFDLSVLPVNI